MILCKICSNNKQIQRIVKKNYLLGAAFDDIAIEIGMDLADVEHHCNNCLKKPRNIKERYKELIDQLEEDLAHTRQVMQERPNAPGLQQGYARIVTEYREVLNKYEELKDPADQVRDLTLSILNPLIKDVLKDTTEEIHRIKTEMRNIDSIPTEVSTKITEELLKNIAERIKIAYLHSQKQLNNYFGVAPDSENIDTDTTIQ